MYRQNSIQDEGHSEPRLDKELSWLEFDCSRWRVDVEQSLNFD